MIITIKDIQRFKSKIKKTNTCWVWTAWKHRQGYGKFSIKSETLVAHRIAWMISRKRLIPKGLCICHHCDNPSCVRPSHLFIGTYQDNATDKVNKNRQAIGNNHGKSKLTETKVQKIRILYFNKNCTQTQLADKFNIHSRTIHKIIHRITWKHLHHVLNEPDQDINFLPKGQDHYNSRITENEVRKIRNIYNTTNQTQTEIAENFNTSFQTVNKIIHRRTWKHI